MVKQPVFHLFLIVSVMAIIVGIMVVIFIQFDRGYVAQKSTEEDLKAQQALIEKFYQDATENELQKPQVGSKPVVSQQFQVSQPVYSENISRVTAPIAPTVTPPRHPGYQRPNQDYFPTSEQQPYFSSYDEYERYWLSTNPWSPDYVPGY